MARRQECPHRRRASWMATSARMSLGQEPMASDAESYQRGSWRRPDPRITAERFRPGDGVRCSHVVATPQRTQHSTSSSYSLISAPDTIRTCDLCLRRATHQLGRRPRIFSCSVKEGPLQKEGSGCPTPVQTPRGSRSYVEARDHWLVKPIRTTRKDWTEPVFL